MLSIQKNVGSLYYRCYRFLSPFDIFNIQDLQIKTGGDDILNFLFASDSFKGSLSSTDCIRLLTKQARKHFPACEITGIPVADGGEGTTTAVLSAVGGTLRQLTVTNPLGSDVTAAYGILPDGSAIMEMSAASGITLIRPELRSPSNTTSYGTGQLILDALNQGVKKIAISLGGSATNDGGIGAMAALGVKFKDHTGSILHPVGSSLNRIATIDLTDLDPRLNEIKMQVMCDVTNPLCGQNGATYVFGPQKGGSSDELDLLEKGMRNYANVLFNTVNADVSTLSGSGAAGGMCASLRALCHATVVSGIETVLDLVSFDKLASQATLVVTGEGCLDQQSANGKVVFGIGQHCKKIGIPAYAIVGCLKESPTTVQSYGIKQVYELAEGGLSVEESMARAEELYLARADRLFHALKTQNT